MKKDLNFKESIVDVLLSKIFHDMGNAINTMGLCIDLGKGLNEELFSDLVKANDGLIATFNVLKACFNDNAIGVEIFEKLKNILENKGKVLIIKKVKISFIDSELVKLLINLIFLVSDFIIDKCVIEVLFESQKFNLNIIGSRFKVGYKEVLNNIKNYENTNIIFSEKNIYLYFIHAILKSCKYGILLNISDITNVSAEGICL